MPDLARVTGLGLLLLMVVGCGSPAAQPAPQTPTSSPRVAAPPPDTTVPRAAHVSAALAGSATAAGSATLQVGNTDGQGVYLRDAPGVGERLRAYPDGTALQVIGPDAKAGGQSWRHVRAPDGLEGYVAAAYVMAGSSPPGEAASADANATSTPAAESPPVESAPAGAPAAVPPAVSGDVRAYAATLLPRAQRVGQSLSALQGQFAGLSANPLLLGDRAWVAETTSMLADLRETGEALRQPEPAPPELERLDALVVEVGDELVGLADDATAGVEQRDVPRLLRAAQRLQALHSRYQTANSEIEALKARYGVQG